MSVTAAKKAVEARPRQSTFWVQGAICGALLAFATPTALLIGILLAPALATAAVEQGPLRGTTRAVALCGAAATLSPAWRLWMQGGQMGAALDLLSDPLTIVLAWGAGACAWAACQVLPAIVAGVWNVREASRAKAIETELIRCREDWDFVGEG